MNTNLSSDETRQQPGDAREARLAHIVSLHNTGEILEAETLCRQLAEADPHDHHVVFLLGLIVHRAGRYTEAIQYFLQAIDLQPSVAQYYVALAESLKEQGSLDDAIDCFHAVLQIDPANADALNGVGDVFLRRHEYEGAITAFERAIEIDPDYVEAYGNLGGALARTGRFDRSIEMSRAALALNDRYLPAFNNLGFVYFRLKRFDEALDWYARALDVDPNDAYLHFHRSMVLLASGCYAPGWNEFEWRLRKSDFAALNKRAKTPGMWNGEPLAGRSILVWCEQGFGDTFQFIRYLPLLRKQARSVVFECQREVLSLLAPCADVERIVARDETGSDELYGCDCHIPLLSLPRLFETTLETVPAPMPYIRATPEAIEKFSAYVSDASLSIGIVWSGGTAFRENAIRSCTLADFLPLINSAPLSSARFFSLQKGEAESQLESLSLHTSITNLGRLCENFEDTSGALHHMDVVITVDTSVAHLAGAMGKPVLLCLMHAHDWRWYATKEWYPSIRPFVQPVPGDWKSVFEAVAVELSRLRISL